MNTTSQHISSPPAMELSFPSELGYEKVAREAVAAFARRLGCDRERVEDLKTALGEGCINAIEVHDQGLKRYESSGTIASIDLKLSGLAPLRGMGLMMIAQLVDEAGFTESVDGGNHFRLVLYFRKI